MKDPYKDRSLPFVIGTPAFLEDDLVGIKEQEQEQSEAESVDEDAEGSEVKKITFISVFCF